MPMCGFDKPMLDGLDLFYRGLADAVIRRSKEDRISVEKAIDLELEDMNEFIQELTKLTTELDKHKLIGLTNYGKSFYLGALERSKQKGILIEKAMDNEIKETRAFLYSVDDQYYKHLKGKKDSPIKELVQWMEKNATIRI